MPDSKSKWDDPTTQGPPPSLRTLVGETIADKYRVGSILGKGGMGTVYEAKHLVLGRHVAIKVLHAVHAKDETAVKRFEQEARAVGTIGHPNLCDVFDFGTLRDGSPYIVMELLRGETLAARIARLGTLPLTDVDIVIQVLRGLEAAHAKGILHRDIKTENVFLVGATEAGAKVKLLDFGVSKVMARSEWDDASFTKTGVVMGTPLYFSPEQARGRRDLDARVDVYACGVLLYEAFTGRRPYEATSYAVLLRKIHEGKITPPRALQPSIPAELETVILKALAQDRDARYASAAELAAALESARSAPVATTSVEIPIFLSGSFEAATTPALPPNDTGPTIIDAPPKKREP